MPEITTNPELALKTQHLIAEQSFIVRQRQFNQPLIEHLQDIGQILDNEAKISHKPPPHFHIVYASPTAENKQDEYWVEPFLLVLYDHLKTAGLRPYLDFCDLKPGGNLAHYMQQLYDGDDILFMGTKSLNDRHKADESHNIKTAISIISRVTKENQGRTIFPLLLNGTIETSFPDFFNYDASSAHVHYGYIPTLKLLLDWLLRDRISKQADYDYLWTSFYEQQGRLRLDSQSVAAEIAIGYHKQRASFLAQDLSYISVKAQSGIMEEKISHQMLDIMDKSQGTFTQVCDNNGEQFQRPNRDNLFIERQQLFLSIKEHFTKQKAEVLVLNGIRGTGKTSMAQHYFLNPVQPYKFRAWFKLGKTEKSLEEQYFQLAKEQELELPSHFSPAEKIRLIKEWLGKQAPLLLIYDDVIDPASLEGFLPDTGLQQEIIITTTNALAWLPASKFYSIEVSGMQESEAIDLISKLTERPQSDDVTKVLINTMQGLPLALRQAAAYMKTCAVDAARYLNRYQENKSYLLNSNNKSGWIKHLPLWQSFDSDLNILKQEKPEAWELLKKLSWIDKTPIAENAVIRLLDCSDSEQLWTKVRSAIMRFSFLHIEGNQLSIHPLLQEVIRSKQEKNEAISSIEKCQEILKHWDRISSDTSLKPHLLCLKQHQQVFAPQEIDEPVVSFKFSLEEKETKSDPSYSYTSMERFLATINQVSPKVELPPPPNPYQEALAKYDITSEEKSLFEKLWRSSACCKLSKKEGFVLEINTSLEYPDKELLKLGLQPCQWEKPQTPAGYGNHFVYIRSRKNSPEATLKKPMDAPLSDANQSFFKPMEIADLQKEARALLVAKDYPRAILKYELLIKAYESRPEIYSKNTQAIAYYGLGLAYFNSKPSLPDKAHLNFKMAVELHPENGLYQRKLDECSKVLESSKCDDFLAYI